MKYSHVLKEISRNKALVGVMLFSLAGMIGASIVNGMNTYLFKDYFGDVKLGAIAGATSVLWTLIAFFITQPLANKLGKKEWCSVGALFAAAIYAVMFLFPLENAMVFIVLNGICFVRASGMQILVWAMVNDAIDYHELRAGERNEGIVYSTYSFFRKLAGAAFSSLSAMVLGFIGYNQAEGAIQTESVVHGIWKSYTAIYVIGYVLAVVLLVSIYPLTKKTIDMLEELKVRRAQKAGQV